MSFREKFQSATKSRGFQLMENREKKPVAEVLNIELTLVDCVLMNGDKGEYVILLVAEHPDNFICGGSVVTSNLKATAEEFGGWDKMVEAIQNDCPTVVFKTGHSKKSGNAYTTMEVK